MPRPRPIALLPLVLLLAGCGAEVQTSTHTPASNTSSANPGSGSTPVAGPDRKRPWWKPPGPIAGKWKTSKYPSDMIVEISVSGSNAVGRVLMAGEGAKRHYGNGEEILSLKVDDFGQWVGQLRKKTLAGADKKEAIRFVATDSVLDAIMTTDEAFKHMSRVE